MPKKSVQLFAALAVLLPCLVALAQSQFTVLHNFDPNLGEGAGLWNSVAFDTQGNMYGTTRGGGAHSYGTVFELSPNADGTWNQAVLHSFANGDTDGYLPISSVLVDGSGNLYATAEEGGSGHLHSGTVFEMIPSSTGWTLKVLHNFGSTTTDGASPKAGLVMDRLGNLYGTASNVFELTPKSSGWIESVLYSFPGINGGNGPYAGVILDPSGNLYGTAQAGGAYAGGVAYEIRHAAKRWKESVPHSFGAFPQDGVGPSNGNLTMDNAGNIYGTTFAGGATTACEGNGCGTIFKLSPTTGGHWKETVLYSFQSVATGFGPGAGVTLDSAGNIYGTTIYGGSTSCACGVVYKLSPNSDGTWIYTILHSFSGNDGGQPLANLVLYNGNLYGTAVGGGSGGGGVVFEITP
ncbi:MAG TPA: choice-of-anchor tandem repeat GloVer-containing protein [Candidatus Sulfotelmatobacter sp.]